MNSENLVVFALGFSPAFGENICGHPGITLSALEERDFEDGEHKTRPLVSVRGKDARMDIYSNTRSLTPWHS